MHQYKFAKWNSSGLRRVIPVLLIFLVALFILTTACSAVEEFKETRDLMNTYVTITVYSNDGEAAEGAIDAAFARMEEIISIASIFDSESEAFKLNQDGYLDNPSNEFKKLITTSIDYGNLTGGSFDITIQPILDLWNEGLWKEEESVQKERVTEALQLTGWDKIAVESNRIYFKTDGMEITLGGIAKGYVVDEALKVLGNNNIKYALVNAGGDMGTIGTKPDDIPWSVSLVNPDDNSQSIATFEFSDKAIATSGNYERYFDLEKKAHHILNPRTGFSTSECISVSIITDNCTRADILATSVFVMGPDEGIKFVDSLDDVECLIIDSDREIDHSSGLARYFKEER